MTKEELAAHKAAIRAKYGDEPPTRNNPELRKEALRQLGGAMREGR